jgi:hypothetical protein
LSKLSVLNSIRKFPPIYGATMSILDLYSWTKSRRQGSYSQHGEDAFVANFFAARAKGFYLDIGASHPFRLSNTCSLYRSGWKGGAGPMSLRYCPSTKSLNASARSRL